MLNTLILFLSIILGFVTIAVILNKRGDKLSPFVNKYLIFLILNTSIRYILHFIYSLDPSILPIRVLQFADTTVLISTPFFYLYFEDLILVENYKTRKLVHFIMPMILICIMAISVILDKQHRQKVVTVFIVSGILYVIIYQLLGFRLLYNNIWFRKSDIKIVQAQNRLISNWTIFLYSTFLSIFLIFLFRFFMIYIDKGTIGYNQPRMWIPALAWNLIYLKFILTPEIQYGFDFLNKKIEEITNQLAIPQLWSTKNPLQEISLARDIKLAEKINNQLKEYIHQIEEAAFHAEIFRKPDITIDEIATHLKIPSSHIAFVFKYHCLETFSDYKKIIRIHDAIKLIENGFLKDSTVESLSTKVGFITYNTFHVAFKNITGSTTQEYIRKATKLNT